MASFIGRYLQY